MFPVAGEDNQNAPASLVEFGVYSATRLGRQGLGDDAPGE